MKSIQMLQLGFALLQRAKPNSKRFTWRGRHKPIFRNSFVKAKPMLDTWSNANKKSTGYFRSFKVKQKKSLAPTWNKIASTARRALHEALYLWFCFTLKLRQHRVLLLFPLIHIYIQENSEFLTPTRKCLPQCGNRAAIKWILGRNPFENRP